ncbi:BatA domain-containing protein [Leeuwenhoekiella palythoae]|uniref:Membrane protein (TIGR02226 family) n=1 Tax=Leeuwenhoekiella palythoae TaxID=573501 RepID=A0A1M5T3W9_9FLAO|nr:BatA domain-containing protein [Leeuwenhoekiella palythoae]RXG28774.1 putative membrane protein (TIGR02226 family) [Leeuwenhoekiella palythoae]SHH45444.1 N-terminal double-transmembrane domain-containing protein [Leeuwenhoekiella palythoae]
MQFKNPEILYALFLLLIPILIHLFQLRRYKKTPFSNVAFLETVIQNTRKSSTLKKWLVLCTRLLALTFLIFAFAEPFIPNSQRALQPQETVIFIDNSFSMQATGKKGNLLTEAKQELLAALHKDERYTLVTWDDVLRDFDPVTDRNELLDLDFTQKTIDVQSLRMRLNNVFSTKDESSRQRILISDFQDTGWSSQLDSLNKTEHRILLEPTSLENISIDSLHLNSVSAAYSLDVFLASTTPIDQDVPVSLFDKEKLIAKGSANFESSKHSKIEFQLTSGAAIQGRLSITTPDLKFDNDFYFSINTTEPLKVLAVSNAEDTFLSRLYQEPQFSYTNVAEDQLEYSILDDQDLIILNEPQRITTALINALKKHTQNGGTLLLIPNMNAAATNYNNLLNAYGFAGFQSKIEAPQRITTINYDHPLYQNVFTKRSSNLQTHQVEAYFPIATTDAILSLENNAPFLAENNRLYLFTGSLSSTNSNFINGQLIVPTFDKIATEALKLPQIYYSIGSKTTFDITTPLPDDVVLTLEQQEQAFIPLQQKRGDKVSIDTQEGIKNDGLYAVKYKQDTLAMVAYNFDRAESNLRPLEAITAENIDFETNIPDLFNKLEQDTNLNLLYKWFVIFALLAFLAEMLLLKKFK